MGFLSVITCRVVNGTSTVLNSNGDIFPKTSVNEMLRSIQYTDLCQEMVSDCTMRSAAVKIQRVLHYGCSHRTLDDWTEREGGAIADRIQKQAKEILEEHRFDPETGSPIDEATLAGALIKPTIAVIPPEEVAEAINKYNENRADDEKISDRWAEHTYISGQNGSNLSLDEICVTEQKSTGRKRGSPRKEHKKRVENTVVHIQQGLGIYILTGLDMLTVVITTLAFLLKNGLLENRMLTIFADGAANIRHSIQAVFGWRMFEVVLDWHHLNGKCKQRLSQITKGSKLQNEALGTLLKYLWIGELDTAIAFLRSIPEANIKSGGDEKREKLIAYFERNRDNIPCYALRKELGLRISSNRVEKSNDLVVASRQKNKGMSWSRDGSTALANIKAMRLNGEAGAWNYTKQFAFSLKYHDQDAA